MRRVQRMLLRKRVCRSCCRGIRHVGRLVRIKFRLGEGKREKFNGASSNLGASPIRGTVPSYARAEILVHPCASMTTPEAFLIKTPWSPREGVGTRKPAVMRSPNTPGSYRRLQDGCRNVIDTFTSCWWRMPRSSLSHDSFCLLSQGPPLPSFFHVP
jgi:hypothetical protein